MWPGAIRAHYNHHIFKGSDTSLLNELLDDLKCDYEKVDFLSHNSRTKIDLLLLPLRWFADTKAFVRSSFWRTQFCKNIAKLQSQTNLGSSTETQADSSHPVVFLSDKNNRITLGKLIRVQKSMLWSRITLTMPWQLKLQQREMHQW